MVDSMVVRVCRRSCDLVTHFDSPVPCGLQHGAPSPWISVCRSEPRIRQTTRETNRDKDEKWWKQMMTSANSGKHWKTLSCRMFFCWRLLQQLELPIWSVENGRMGCKRDQWFIFGFAVPPPRVLPPDHVFEAERVLIKQINQIKHQPDISWHHRMTTATTA